VLDGAIRNVAQASRYQTYFASSKKEDEVIAIEISLDDETATDRILERARHSGEARADDAPESIAERMKSQGNGAIAPIREYYEELGKYVSVDGKEDITSVKTAVRMVLT
jgi:adenylate kinase